MIDILNRTEIINLISPNNKNYIAQLDVLPTIDSTNDYLLRLAKEKLPSGSICIADEQTKGRGRQGKEWFSPKAKNIYLSLSWNFPHQLHEISNLSLALGVIITKALDRLKVENGLQLKWPNDIFYENRKLAGILVETVGHTVVIGIGLNVYMQHPDTIGLAELLHVPASRNQIIAILIDELVANIPLYINNGFALFHDVYIHHDMLCNRAIVIREGKFEIVGHACGVTTAGELQLRDQKGMLHTFRCGEVSVVLEN